LIGGLTILALVLYVPYARSVFRFSFLHPADLAICSAAAVASVLWFEVWKRLRGVEV